MVTEVQALILAVLSYGGESHGHAIGKAMEARRGKPLGVGTLYKALHALDRDGLVESQWQPQPKAEFGRPRRRIYEINGAGERALSEYRDHIETTRRHLRPSVRGAQA